MANAALVVNNYAHKVLRGRFFFGFTFIPFYYVNELFGSNTHCHAQNWKYLHAWPKLPFDDEMQKYFIKNVTETGLENRTCHIYNGVEPFSVGLATSRTRLHILLPRNLFLRENNESARLHVLRILEIAYKLQMQNVLLVSQRGRDIVDTFILSEEARKFVVRMHLYWNDPFFKASKAINISILIILWLEMLIRFVKVRRIYFVSLPAIGFALLSSTVIFMSGNIIFNALSIAEKKNAIAKALTNGEKDGRGIELAIRAVEDTKIDDTMARGAIEYFQKLMTRNKLLFDSISSDATVNQSPISMDRFDKFGNRYNPLLMKIDASHFIETIEKWSKSEL